MNIPCGSIQLEPSQGGRFVFQSKSLISKDGSPSSHEENTHVKNKLGTITGCYVPCLLNILGIVLFERLGWAVGQIGIAHVISIYIVAELAVIFTVLSLSAIVTNGNMRGGGSYYMISRTLGPEFGGSIGLLFYCAYCVNIAFCCMGCAEEITETWFGHSNSFWANEIFIASVVLFICFVVALGGANLFSKINFVLFSFTVSAIIFTFMSSYFRGEFSLPDDSQYEHQVWNAKQFGDNWSTPSAV